jgi:hypothetical protein
VVLNSSPAKFLRLRLCLTPSRGHREIFGAWHCCNGPFDLRIVSGDEDAVRHLPPVSCSHDVVTELQLYERSIACDERDKTGKNRIM